MDEEELEAQRTDAAERENHRKEVEGDEKSRDNQILDKCTKKKPGSISGMISKRHFQYTKCTKGVNYEKCDRVV